MHDHCDKRHRELGPIYREHLGSSELVFLADTKLIQTVIANEGPHPHHNVPDAWKFYNKIHNVERGLFFQVGEPWSRARKVFNRVMLADPKAILTFTEGLLKINEDLKADWNTHKKNLEGFVIIDDIKSELCKWSIESTGLMLFGNRMGCVANELMGDKISSADELVSNVSSMFAETSRFQVLPVQLAHRLNLNVWRRFELATSNMIRIANDYAIRNIKQLKKERSGQSLIKKVLNSGALSEEEISRSVVDLIIAAADTTSNSLQWMFYLLAKNPAAQSKIHKEINLFMDRSIDHSQMNDNTVYLRAFIREVSRLYPTAPFLARTLDKDIALGGYLVPAGKTIVFSLYTTSRMEEYFDQPLEFKPERWIRSNLCRGGEVSSNCGRRNHAYASLPFGIGARNCVGRRAAELEMILLIASIVNEFQISTVDDEEISVKLRMILGPSKPIRLKFVNRRR